MKVQTIDVPLTGTVLSSGDVDRGVDPDQIKVTDTRSAEATT